MSFELRPYQRANAERLATSPRAALWWPPGLGKTATVSTALIERLYDRFELGRVLVVAPKTVADDVWPEELARFPFVPWRRIGFDDFGLSNPRDEAGRPTRLSFKDVSAARKRLRSIGERVWVTSYDGLPWLAKVLAPGWFDGLVLDESGFVRTKSAQRWRAARHFATAAKWVVELNGTPKPNDWDGVWGQIALLDGGARLGRSLTEFRGRWFMPGARNAQGVIFEWRPRPGAEAQIQAAIADVAFSLPETMVGLPPLIVTERRVALPDAARRAYDEMERTAVAQLAGGAVTGVNAAAVVGKLLQIANGAVYDDTRRVHELHEAKLDALADLVETGDNLLVLYGYEHDLSRIRRRFPFARDAKDPKVREAWNRGEVRLMVAHPASCGHGLNLQSGGCRAVWFGVTHNLEHYLQANKRLHRPGQQNTVTICHLLAEGTIERTVMQVLNAKDASQQRLMAAVRDRLVEGGR